MSADSNKDNDGKDTAAPTAAGALVESSTRDEAPTDKGVRDWYPYGFRGGLAEIGEVARGCLDGFKLAEAIGQGTYG